MSLLKKPQMSLSAWTALKERYVTVDPIAAIVELTALSGIQVRCASAILHLCHSQRYPLLDFRAMEAFGVTEEATANWNELSWLRVWKPYTTACCELAEELDLTMRDIDRALWVLGRDAALVRNGVSHA